MRSYLQVAKGALGIPHLPRYYQEAKLFSSGMAAPDHGKTLVLFRPGSRRCTSLKTPVATMEPPSARGIYFSGGPSDNRVMGLT